MDTFDSIHDTLEGIFNSPIDALNQPVLLWVLRRRPGTGYLAW